MRLWHCCKTQSLNLFTKYNLQFPIKDTTTIKSAIHSVTLETIQSFWCSDFNRSHKSHTSQKICSQLSTTQSSRKVSCLRETQLVSSSLTQLGPFQYFAIPPQDVFVSHTCFGWLHLHISSFSLFPLLRVGIFRFHAFTCMFTLPGIPSMTILWHGKHH